MYPINDSVVGMAQNITGIASMIQYANYVTDYAFIVLFVGIMWFIIFMVSKGQETLNYHVFLQTGAVASFITAIITLFFWSMNLINDTWLIFYVALLILFVMALYVFD